MLNIKFSKLNKKRISENRFTMFFKNKISLLKTNFSTWDIVTMMRSPKRDTNSLNSNRLITKSMIISRTMDRSLEQSNWFKHLSITIWSICIQSDPSMLTMDKLSSQLVLMRDQLKSWQADRRIFYTKTNWSMSHGYWMSVKKRSWQGELILEIHVSDKFMKNVVMELDTIRRIISWKIELKLHTSISMFQMIWIKGKRRLKWIRLKRNCLRFQGRLKEWLKRVKMSKLIQYRYWILLLRRKKLKCCHQYNKNQSSQRRRWILMGNL